MKHTITLAEFKIERTPLPQGHVHAWWQGVRVLVDLVHQIDVAGVVVADDKENAEVEKISLFTNSQCIVSMSVGTPETGPGMSENSHYATFPGVSSPDPASGMPPNE